MEFDFDKVTDRRNLNSLKWNVKENELPLWVADMDFETAPAIKLAVEKRAASGIFGYTIIPRELYKSYISWWKRRYDFDIKEESLIFSTGVVPSISSCVRKLTSSAEKVLVLTPCYNIFFNSIINNGRFVKECPLGFDGKKYFIDFKRLEADLSDEQVSLMILCNPQNPTGNIWQKEELSRIGELCKKYGVIVLSDEIHCDIVRPGKKYVPFASASKTCASISVTCLSPTKCFNLAGINSSVVMIENKFLRHKVWRALNTDEIAEANVFAVPATVAAFNESEDYLNSLNRYLFENRDYASSFISSLSEQITVIDSDATYLLWVKVPCDGDTFVRELRKQTGLWINAGSEYGKACKNFVRINLACPRSILEDAMQRLKKFILQ